MHGIGVIPENTEIFSGAFHGSKSTHYLIGIGNAARIGVLGNAPNALECRIAGNQFLDGVHIGTFVGHGNGNHLNAKRLGNAEVAIVARNRANKLHLIQLAPRSGAKRAEHPATHDGVIHDVQAGIAENNGVICFVIEHGSHELLGLRQTINYAIVANVGTVFSLAIIGRRQDVQHRHAQIELIGARLTACHIQGQTLSLIGFVFFGECSFERGELFFPQFRVSGHHASFHLPYKATASCTR